jgi:D-alanine-D-alanine ligase
VLDGKPLGAVEIVPKRGFYDFHNKYAAAAPTTTCPRACRPSAIARCCGWRRWRHEALGCDGATRVDLVVSERGNEVILEVNTLPGMTPNSLLPKIAHGAGLSFEDLVEEMLHGRAPARPRPPRDRRAVQVSFPGPSAAAASCPTRTSRSARRLTRPLLRRNCA